MSEPTSQASGVEPAGETDQAAIPGDRGIASVNQARSLQSRITAGFAIVLMGALAAGLLTWYYRGVIARSSAKQNEVTRTLARRAQGEMTLPPLGREPVPVETPPQSSALAALLGPQPQMPRRQPVANHAAGSSSSANGAGLDRRLKGAVFAPLGSTATAGRMAVPTDALSMEGATGGATAESHAGELGELLVARPTAAVAARVLPTQRLLLPKGAFLDCTLETAIDSQLPGMTTCITATDTYGADGTVVLLERGSKLVGETRGQVRQGGSRLFVVWTEARTPTGVVIPLASPGTDELGRSGMSGDVERHFWARFGAALLVSVIDGAVQAGSRASQSSTLIISPTGPRDLATEVLRETVRIPSTLRKPHGDRIQVLVARDLDFRSVYQLKVVAERQ